MTTEHEASRTLVKSPPELWAECSDAGSLARHLGEFGEIKITRLEPESTVAWEGEHVSGTVRIEPSGWGTRVTLTAQRKAEAVEPEEPALAEPGRIAVPGVPLFAQAPDAGEEPSDVELLSQQPTAEEASDAKVEETLEDAVPAPVDDTGGPRARWRRITARMRGFFGAAEPEKPIAEPEPAPEPEPEPEPAAGPEPEGERQLDSAAESEPEGERQLDAAAESEPEAERQLDAAAESEPEAEPELDAAGILTAALDSLGQAHHRPFSRA